MTTDTLVKLLQGIPGRSVRLTPAQENILKHPGGPGWVLAGPGSGKTEVLTVMVLRLLYVENDPVQKTRIPPEAIFITTFTEKAARNLEDRISVYRAHLVGLHPDLAEIDISKLRIGTLHGLCNDLLQEFRSPDYQNVRLMDEMEQGLFVYEHLSIVDKPNQGTDHPFWKNFDFCFSARQWKSSYPYLPRRWDMVGTLVKLFNRIVEDRVDLVAMKAKGGEWARLADLYQEYLGLLKSYHRSDFAHLQKTFLEFLPTQLGQVFLYGDPQAGQSGVRWVLVDEYQDTNLIQEEIYLSLAKPGTHNVLVVGDDDQAMYRFRGGSVECMVTFGDACKVFLGVRKSAVVTYPLVENFRSHKEIVDFSDAFINAFPVIKKPGARVPGKPKLAARSAITGSHPVVGTLSAGAMEEVAARFAATVKGLVANKVVNDPSECCLLLRSAKDSPHNAGKYIEALIDAGLKPYNPRNKAFLDQEEVQALLGTIIMLLDHSGMFIPDKPVELQQMVAEFLSAYEKVAKASPTLKRYIDDSVGAFTKKPGSYLTANLQQCVYFILSLPPFDGWQNDPVRRVRLAQLTSLFETYSSIPVPNHPNLSRGSLKVSSHHAGTIVDGWLRTFYHQFFGYLSRVGLDDEEDEDVICPAGMVPIMTMHQSKGLEFPFVFVGHMGVPAAPSLSHQLEDAMAQFPGNPGRKFSRPSAQDRADLDMIRQYFVAYSRAEYALILMGTTQQFGKGCIPCGPTKTWLKNHSLPL